MNNSAGNFRETVWMHIDRHLYLSGERITFQARILERDSYRISDLSKNIRIELTDSDGARLVKLNITLLDKGAEGSIPLPGDLKSGWYYLRAYTNWMRNFPDSEFTVIPVKVINPAALATLPETPRTAELPALPAQKNELVITTSYHNLIVKPLKTGSGMTGNIRLLAHRSGTWYWFDSRKFTESMSFTVPISEIPEGLVQFSLLADDGAVIARQLWYNSSPVADNIEIKGIPDTAQIRSQWKADYHRSGVNGKDESFILSAFVSLDEPGNTDDSCMPGMPGWTCNPGIPTGKETFGKWLEDNTYPNEIIQAFFSPAQEINKGLTFLPETRTSMISGRVVNRKTGIPVSETGIGVSLLAANRFNAIKTNRDGLFYFTFPDLKGTSDYILSFISEPDSAWSIEVFGEFDKRPFKPRMLPFSLSSEESAFARELNTNLQLNRVFSKEETAGSVGKVSVIREKPFYDPPDRTIYTDNYIELANVGEVVYEVVPDVQVRRDGNRSFISVYSTQPFAREYETLVLLDGIPLASQKELLELPPGRIKSIDVRNKIYIHGNYTFSAVVNFISLNGDFAGLMLPARSVKGILSTPVMSRPKEYSAAKPDSPIPMLNPVLLWQTGLNSDTGTIGFSVNDLYGDYSIRVYGFDNNGKWISGKSKFKVTPQSR